MAGIAGVGEAAAAEDSGEVEQLREQVRRLQRENDDLTSRLELVEEIVGPTEAQRKIFQEQIAAARAAALQAHRNGAGVPVRFLGRINETWLRGLGLSERDCALLQRGCVTGPEGVPKDVSLLGDPAFRPYDEVTKAPRWEARGGLLKLSLSDVRDRWGEEVALEVVRCAVELDRYDASRRLGLELPWSDAEGRELDAAEVIGLLERELEDLRRARGCGRSTGSTAAASGQRPALDDEAFEDSLSEASSMGLGPGQIQEIAALSPTWSMIEESCAAITESQGFQSPPWTSRGPATEDDDDMDQSSEHGYTNMARPPWSASVMLDQMERYDEWSLADADIEQLLCQPGLGVAGLAATGVGAGGVPRKRGADVARSIISTPRDSDLAQPPCTGASCSDEDRTEPECAEENFSEVLRELLEEEVVTSIGRLLAQTPPPTGAAGLGERDRRR